MRSLQIRVRFADPEAPRETWFAARLRFAVLTHRAGLERFVESVVLLKASDREAAFQKAIQLGYDREQAYQSVEGVGVRWGFASVAALDEIPDRNWNGLEVATIPVAAEPADHRAFGFDHTFQPEQSLPLETRLR